MAMRARVFDEWKDSMLDENKDALVLHIGCELMFTGDIYGKIYRLYELFS